jgi:hypothetical protein
VARVFKETQALQEVKVQVAFLDLQALRVVMVDLDQRVMLVQEDHREILAIQDSKEIQELQALVAPKEIVAALDPADRKDLRDHREDQDLKATREIPAQGETLDVQVQMVQLVHEETKASKVTKEMLVPMEEEDLQEARAKLVDLVLLDHQDREDLLDHKDHRD